MPICTTCAAYTPYLYTVYESAYNLRLEQCVRVYFDWINSHWCSIIYTCFQQGCQSFVDPYVEHDTLTLLLDLILLKRGVYRHLLYNRGTKPRREIAKSKPEIELADVTHSSYLSRARRIWTLKLGAGLITLDACMLLMTFLRVLRLKILQLFDGPTSVRLLVAFYCAEVNLESQARRWFLNPMKFGQKTLFIYLSESFSDVSQVCFHSFLLIRSHCWVVRRNLRLSYRHTPCMLHNPQPPLAFQPASIQNSLSKIYTEGRDSYRPRIQALTRSPNAFLLFSNETFSPVSPYNLDSNLPNCIITSTICSIWNSNWLVAWVHFQPNVHSPSYPFRILTCTRRWQNRPRVDNPQYFGWNVRWFRPTRSVFLIFFPFCQPSDTQNSKKKLPPSFLLTVILDIHPAFSTLIILSGWASKTAATQFVKDWVGGDTQMSQAWLAYSIP